MLTIYKIETLDCCGSELQRTIHLLPSCGCIETVVEPVPIGRYYRQFRNPQQTHQGSARTCSEE